MLSTEQEGICRSGAGSLGLGPRLPDQAANPVYIWLGSDPSSAPDSLEEVPQLLILPFNIGQSQGIRAPGDRAVGVTLLSTERDGESMGAGRGQWKTVSPPAHAMGGGS